MSECLHKFPACYKSGFYFFFLPARLLFFLNSPRFPFGVSINTFKSFDSASKAGMARVLKADIGFDLANQDNG
ncbi:MAG: hypothetical protein WBV94_31150 [Blastocatellia bacterium]